MVYRSFLTLTGIGLLIFVLQLFHPSGWLPRLTSPVQPVLASETEVSRKAVNLFGIIAGIRNLAKDNVKLQTKSVELEAKIAELKEVEHENIILRQELNFIKESDSVLVPAQLIGRTATGIIKDLIISRGTKDGLTVGQPVIAQGFLIGLVNSVSDRAATVILLTNPRSLIPVTLQDSRATGILRGGISGLTVTDLLIDADIHQGEMVITSGLGGQLPAGIPIGKVITVTARKGDITKKASVEPPLDVTKLELVFIRKVR